MILFDTNVLIYAFEHRSPYSAWARETIAEAVSGEGGGINAVSLAEICVGDAEPSTVAQRVRTWGVEILDVPVAAAEVCSRATWLIVSGAARNPARTRPECPSPTSSSAPTP